MAHVHNTVFISYRRIDEGHARSIFEQLEAAGYDCFFDRESISAGRFWEQIRQNILGRAHFVVLLGPYTLERCRDKNDVLRWEIETAILNRRNIVPLFFENFSFKEAMENGFMPGHILPELQEYQGFPIYPEYFREGVSRLVSSRYLHKATEVEIHPMREDVIIWTENQKELIRDIPTPSESQLRAERGFEEVFHQLLSGVTESELNILFRQFEQHPDQSEVHHFKGLTYAYLKRYDEAIEEFSNAIRLKPDEAIHYYNRGLAYGQSNNLDAAVNDFTEAIDLNKEYVSAYINRGISYRKLGQHALAIADHSHALSLSPHDPSIQHRLACDYSEAGELKQAEKFFALALNSLPEDDNIYADRARMYGMAGFNEKALQDIDSALKRNKDNADALNILGIIQTKTGDAKSAINTLTHAVRIDEHNPDIRNNLAIAYTHEHLFEQARSILIRVLDTNPDHFGALVNMGVACLNLEDYEQAEQYYSHALSLKSDSEEALIGLAHVNHQRGNITEALNNLNKIFAINPRNIPARILMAEVSLQTGDTNVAKQELHQSRRLDPDIGLPYFLLSAIDVSDGDFTAAINNLEEVRQRDGNSYGILHLIGLLHFFQNNYEEAADKLSQAIDFGDQVDAKQLAESYYYKALSKNEVGEIDHASDDVLQAIRLDTEDVRFRYLSAILAFAKGKYQEAILEYHAIARIEYPDNCMIGTP